MFPCSGCKRHILDSESICPFCGLEQRAAPAPIEASSTCVSALVLVTTLGLSLAGLSACGRQLPSFEEGELFLERVRGQPRDHDHRSHDGDRLGDDRRRDR